MRRRVLVSVMEKTREGKGRGGKGLQCRTRAAGNVTRYIQKSDCLDHRKKNVDAHTMPLPVYYRQLKSMRLIPTGRLSEIKRKNTVITPRSLVSLCALLLCTFTFLYQSFYAASPISGFSPSGLSADGKTFVSLQVPETTPRNTNTLWRC